MADTQEGAGGDMMAMMGQMMPAMMEQFFSKMSADDMSGMMHEMMEGCFAKMDMEQRRGMLTMCREMLDQMEAKHVS